MGRRATLVLPGAELPWVDALTKLSGSASLAEAFAHGRRSVCRSERWNDGLIRVGRRSSSERRGVGGEFAPIGARTHPQPTGISYNRGSSAEPGSHPRRSVGRIPHEISETTMTPSSSFRTLCTLCALLLLAVPTVVFCLECVGLCGEASPTVAAHAHESAGMAVTKSQGHPAQATQPSAVMPSGHCGGDTTAPAPVDGASAVGPETQGASLPASSVTADCCADSVSTGAENPATLSAGPELGAHPLLGSFVAASSFVLAKDGFAGRSDVPIQHPPLFRLHAALLL